MGLKRRLLTSLPALIAAGCLAAPPDTDRPSTPSAPTDCGSLSALSDDLGDELRDWNWAMEGSWGADGTAVHLTPEAQELSGMYARGWRWLDRGELTVRFDMSAMADDALLELELTSGDDEISLVRDGDVLRAEVHQADFNGTRSTVAFEQRLDWWRIARVGDRWHWFTSVDGTVWTEQMDFEAALSGLGSVAVVHTAGAGPSDVAVEALNPDGATEPPCPLAGFRDDFSAPSPRWAVLEETACDLRFGDGAEMALSGAELCGLITAERFSLEDSQISLELREVGDCSLSPALHVAFDGGDFTLVCAPEPEGPILRAFFSTDVAGGEEVGSTVWDQASHRHLRLRHAPAEGGVLYETSPDGIEWNGLGSATDLNAVDLASVEVSLTVYSQTPAPPDARAVFDQVNILPDSE